MSKAPNPNNYLNDSTSKVFLIGLLVFSILFVVNVGAVGWGGTLSTTTTTPVFYEPFNELCDDYSNPPEIMTSDWGSYAEFDSYGEGCHYTPYLGSFDSWTIELLYRRKGTSNDTRKSGEMLRSNLLIRIADMGNSAARGNLTVSIRCQYGPPGGLPIVFQSSKGMKNNTWSHAALVCEGNMMVLYDNGVEANTLNTSPCNCSYYEFNHLSIGIDPRDNRSYGWNGSLDEVKIWDRVLTENEIKHSWEMGNLRNDNTTTTTTIPSTTTTTPVTTTTLATTTTTTSTTTTSLPSIPTLSWNNKKNDTHLSSVSHLSNFVFLINSTSLIDTSSSGLNLDSNCSSFRLVNGSENTELSFEIVNISGPTYGCQRKQTEIWGKANVKSSGINTYVYYGNNSPVPGNSSPANVWDSNYLLVMHGNHNSSTNAADTSHQSQANYTGVVKLYNRDSKNTSFTDSGLFGSAFNFSHDKGTGLLWTQGTNGGYSELTFEAWIYPICKFTGSYLFSNDLVGANSQDLGVDMKCGYNIPTQHQGRFRVFINNGNSKFYSTEKISINNGTWPGDQWHYVVAVFNQSGYYLYINGTLDNKSTDTVARYGGVDPVWQIGNAQTQTSGFDGFMDEIRFSNVSRSEDYIKANWEQRYGNFSVVATDSVRISLDTDGDGIYDHEDLCLDTTGDQIVDGCSCEQILNFMSTKIPVPNKVDCPKGVVRIFEKRKGWAKDIPRPGE